MSQMQRQEKKTPEKQLNEVKIDNISEKEFRVKIVKMSQGLRQTMQKTQEMFTKNLEELKRNRNE